MRLFLSRLRDAVAFVTTVAVFATSTEALAQSRQSAEENTYHAENIAGTNDGLDDHSPLFINLNTQTEISEARNAAGTLLRVWRANEDSSVAAGVWADWTNGRAFQLTGVTTFVNPVVVPLGTRFWMVLVTGTDGAIQTTIVLNPTADLNDANWAGNWVSIPNQSTNMAVSAVQYRNSGAVFVVYRGSGIDRQVYGTYFNSSSGGWAPSQRIASGEAVSSPSITYNPIEDQLWVTASGTDNAVWVTHQQVGATGWPDWTSLDRLTQAPPQIAATADGLMTISFVDTAGHPNYRTFDRNLNPLTGWTVDTVTNWVTRNAVGLAVVGVQLYALFVGFNNTAYYKRLR